MSRRLAALVVADVVNYTRLLAADEGGTLAALKELRKAVVEPLVKHHTGRVVKFMGDGVLIEFASAVNAVALALDLQRRTSEINEPLPEARRIVLRIGINLGEVVGEGSDIFGDGVNIAARLEALSEPGGIAISGKVYQEVRGKIDAAFVDLGERSLHNVPAPVRTYRLAAKPATVMSGAKPSAEPQLISVAVLPFTNMSGDASQEYFADGLTEDLITALAKSRHLHVLSRNATSEYKGRAVNIPEIGKQLGARYVLEGSVRTGGNRVRVTAQLINSATGGHVWAERFDREMADIFAVQDEIVGAIAGRLALGLVDTFTASRRKAPTENLTAYEHLLKGRSAWRLGSFVETRDHYLKAAELDPGYAAALAGLSFLYSYDLYTQLIDERPAERERQARSYAARAIACDDGDDYIQHSIGTSFLCLGELEKAKHHLETAISLNPFFPYSWMNLGNTLSCLGMHKEALELIGKGFRLEPRVAPAMRVDFEVYTALGDCAAACDAFNQINRPFAFQHLLLACCFAQADRAEEAAKAMGGFETERGPSFDTLDFARRWVSLYRLQEDKERLRTGFGKLGIDV